MSGVDAGEVLDDSSAMQISGVQMSSASAAQMPSQATLQQKGSMAQIAASQATFSQPIPP